MRKRQTYYQESAGKVGLDLDRGKKIFFFLKRIMCLATGELILRQYSCLKNAY